MAARDRLTRIRLVAGVIAALAVALLAPGGASAATTFTVNTTNDSSDTGGCVTVSVCSLRDAVAAANAASGASTIDLSGATYKLTLGELDITTSQAVTINGVGSASTVIDANFMDRAVEVSSANGNVQISGVTIENGRPGGLSSSTSCPHSAPASGPGGAILTAGALQLTGDVLTGNLSSGDGGAVDDTGGAAVVLKDTALSDNKACSYDDDFVSGGGLSEDGGGTVTIDSSTFTANEAFEDGTDDAIADGGGVAEEGGGSFTITNTTFDGNSATDDGGGIAGEGGGTVDLFADTLNGNSSGDGGGMYIATSEVPEVVSIVNTTITANSAVDGGGIFQFFASTAISYSTITGNSASDGAGNLEVQSFAGSPKRTAETAGSQVINRPVMVELIGITLDDTIVAGGIGPDGTTCHTNDGPAGSGYADNGHNLFDDDGSACNSSSGEGDVTNKNPDLGPLANYGGPTETEALLLGSPAIDAGDDSLCPETENANGQQVDERGVSRPQGPHCDIGAYEFGDADVGVSVAVEFPTIFVGQPDTLTDTVTNNGPSYATDTVFTDPAPPGLRFDTVTSSQGTCTNTATTVTCSLGVLAKGASVTIRIGVTATAVGTQSVTSHVSAAEPDPNPANNSATGTIDVVKPSAPAADLALKKTVSPGLASVGTRLVYTLAVVNHGPHKGTHVKVVDKLPSTLSFDSVHTNRGSCSGGQTVTCKLGTLKVGGHATVTIVATAKAAVTILNRAVVSASQPDPHLRNNRSSAVAGVAKQLGCVRRMQAHALRLAPGPFTALVYVDGRLVLSFQGTQLPLGEIRHRAHHGIVHILIFQGDTKQVFELDFSRCQRANIALE